MIQSYHHCRTHKTLMKNQRIGFSENDLLEQNKNTWNILPCHVQSVCECHPDWNKVIRSNGKGQSDKKFLFGE